MYGIKMVPIDKQVVVSGGFDNDVLSDVYKLDCVSSGCTWQSMAPLQLSVARNYHVAVAVPDDFVNCP